jgi:hypothetical protein
MADGTTVTKLRPYRLESGSSPPESGPVGSAAFLPTLPVACFSGGRRSHTGQAPTFLPPAHALPGRVGHEGGVNQGYDLASCLSGWRRRSCGSRSGRHNKAMKLTKGGPLGSDVGARRLRMGQSSVSGPGRSRPSQLIAGVRRT